MPDHAGDLTSQSITWQQQLTAGPPSNQAAESRSERPPSATASADGAGSPEASSHAGTGRPGRQRHAALTLPTDPQSMWPVFIPAMTLRGASLLAQNIHHAGGSHVDHAAADEQNASSAQTHTHHGDRQQQKGEVASSATGRPSTRQDQSVELGTAALIREIEAHFQQAQTLLEQHRSAGR